MTAKKKFFKTPLDQICGVGNSNNKYKFLYEPRHYIYFKDNFIYATNGNIALKQHMDLHGIGIITQEVLNGQAMHKDVFKLLNRQNNVEFKVLGMVNIMEFEEIIAEFKIAGSKFMCGLKKHKDVTGQGKIIDQINNAFSKFNMNKVDEIAINPDYITLLRKVMVTKSSGFTFRFNTKTGGVLVTPNKNNYKEHAIITPLIVTGEISDKI